MDAHRMSSLEYLDQNDVTSYLKDMMTIILESRPERPVDFMVDYFRNLVEGKTPFERSYHYVRLALGNDETFHDNILLAYRVLQKNEQNRGSMGTSKADYSRLVQLLCHDHPAETNKIIMNLI